MSDHPTLGELRRFPGGALPLARFRRVLAHVRRCDDCRREVEPEITFRPEEVDESQPGEVGPEYDTAVEKAIVAVLRRHRQVEREQAEVALLRAAVAEGRKNPSDLSEREVSHLRGLSMVELLLERSRALRYRDPNGMVQLAELALLGVDQLDPRLYGCGIVADLRARVLGELANAQRVADNLFAAEDALGRAILWARRGTRDPLVVARLADLNASLLSDQRRFSEAIEVLGRVHRLYKELREDHLAGRALIKKGIFTGYNDEPRKAIALLSEGLCLVNPGREPGLILSAFNTLAWNLVECGLYRKARIMLWRTRWLYREDGNKLNLLRVRWLEGRVYAGLEELDRAEGALQTTRRGFKRVGKTYDAALVSLDLAMLWARQGKRAETRVLAQELIVSFRRHGIAREATAALLLARDWCDRWWVPDDVLHDRFKLVAALVAEVRHGRDRRLEKRR